MSDHNVRPCLCDQCALSDTRMLDQNVRNLILAYLIRMCVICSIHFWSVSASSDPCMSYVRHPLFAWLFSIYVRHLLYICMFDQYVRHMLPACVHAWSKRVSSAPCMYACLLRTCTYTFLKLKPERNRSFLLSDQNVSIHLGFGLNKTELFTTVFKFFLPVWNVYICSKLLQYQNWTLVIKQKNTKTKTKRLL